MVQYGIWPDCSNSCDFCLLKHHGKKTPKEDRLLQLNDMLENIKTIDWITEFSDGISLLGGELYFTQDPDLQKKFLEVIDTIIEYVLLPNKKAGNKRCRYSTVTNGIYDPTFLFKVLDKIVNAVGIEYIDINFSYDLKYRFHSEESRLLCLNNINAVIKRYNYELGVQMILTQNLIDAINNRDFDIDEFENIIAPGSKLCLLYPHPIHDDKILPGFQFNREPFLKFLLNEYSKHNRLIRDFIFSVYNSGVYKYSGMYWKRHIDDDGYFYTYGGTKQVPILTEGKEVLTECGHSVLYRCYADSDKCCLCDIQNIFKHELLEMGNE